MGPVAVGVPGPLAGREGRHLEEVHGNGVEQVLGDDVAGEGIAHVGVADEVCRERIVDRQRGRAGLAAETEIAVVHGVGRHGGANGVGAGIFKVPLEAGEEERAVAAVVDFGKVQRAAHQRSGLVIGEGIRPR